MIKRYLDFLYYVIEVLSSYLPIVGKLYILLHTPSVKKEIETLDLKRYENIIHIGCGAIPYTCFILAKNHKGKIIGIDWDQKIIHLARNYQYRFYSYDNLTIEIGDGTNYDISAFDLIILSYGIRDHNKVLHHVFETMKPESKILLRKPNNESNPYLESIINQFSLFKLRLLLTQESILLKKPTKY
jgi:precorrin-6B methylase 2